MRDVQDTLLGIVMRLAAGEPISADQAARLLIAASGDEEPGRALGLDRSTRVKLRDQALRRAAALLAADGVAGWPLAVRLSKAVERFQSRIWPRLKAGGALADLNQLDLELACAHMAGERVLKSNRGLYELLK